MLQNLENKLTYDEIHLYLQCYIANFCHQNMLNFRLNKFHQWVTAHISQAQCAWKCKRNTIINLYLTILTFIETRLLIWWGKLLNFLLFLLFFWNKLFSGLLNLHLLLCTDYLRNRSVVHVWPYEMSWDTDGLYFMYDPMKCPETARWPHQSINQSINFI